jgi:hypothetical protein
MFRKKLIIFAFTAMLLCIYATPVFAEDDIPTVDDVMGQITGGKQFPVTLDEFTNIIIALSINIIRVLQTIAAPVAIMAMILGAITYVAGLVTVNTQLRRAGSGSMAGSIMFFIVIKMAPVIVATIEGFVK